MAYPKHDKAIALARRDLKLGVREQPLGSNTNGRVKAMQAHTWLGGTGWPWCVAACVTWAEEAGFVLPYQGAGAYAFLDWARKAGWAVTAPHAIPGDFVVFSLGAGHMGMLERPVRGSTVYTIDGNVSHRVDDRSRELSVVRGFVHLPERHVVKKAKPPRFEVVTSESGHKVIYASTAYRIGKKLAQILDNHPAGVTIRRRKKKRP